MQIDMHSHAFADKIAERAISALNARLNEEYRTGFDGRLATLIGEMKSHAIDRALICQIATKPAQFDVLLDWAEMVRGGEFGEDAAEMIIPTLSVHPEDDARDAHLAETAARGFKGVKLHPYYQGFVLDSPGMIDYFKSVRDNNLFAIIHAGYDAGFPFDEICGPRRILNVLEKVPDLRLMVSHFGGWLDWEEVNRVLIGAPIDIEISMTAGICNIELMRSMLQRHPHDRIYFGSDWPWSSYDRILPVIDSCNLTEEHRRALMGGNAVRFLGISD